MKSDILVDLPPASVLSNEHVTLPSDSDYVENSEIVERLIAATGPKKRQLICEAELSKLTDEDLYKLLPVLWDYILAHRDSNDPLDLVAVGSAIRQYVAKILVSKLANLATLLEPGYRAAVPLEVELEVAKMAYRKFEANPPVEPDPYPNLSDQLADIVLLYLHPRILPREKYAAVTLLAIQALAVMRSPATGKIILPLNESPFKWLRQQLHRRLKNTVATWQQRNTSAETVNDLVAFIENIQIA